MASHHQHHLCHHPPLPTLTPTCYCHSYYAPYTPCHHHPQPPPDTYPHHPNLHQYHPHFEEHYLQEEKQTHPTVSSLILRISALESALRRRSSSSSSFPHSLRDAAARTIQTHFRAFLLRRSRTLRQLKELSSIKLTLSIIKSSVSEKTHFDCNVVYGKAMALLRKLDTIQGGDPMVRDGKSSISREINKFLDFIGGFLVERRELSSRVNVRYGRNNMKYRVLGNERKMGNVKYGGLERVNEDKLKGLLKKIDKLEDVLEEEESEVIESPVIRKHIVNGGLAKLHGRVQPTVKKSVSFADDGKVYKFLRKNREPFLDEDCGDDIFKDDLVGARELGGDLCLEVEEIGVSPKEPEDDDDEEESHSEDGGSKASSEGEKDFRSYPISEGNLVRMRHNQGENDTFVFSAPLPVKMETRADLIEKRNKIAE
ncbi:hypothetical protein ACJIZ3_002023 [Penstemon smallii]|uniref:BAG family molecular chaperone regulator 8, chloroplastic n=1 Tax=Penstemon smallii TaxID=265156 RepID=A0ABD3U6N4_9LAMI